MSDERLDVEIAELDPTESDAPRQRRRSVRIMLLVLGLIAVAIPLAAVGAGIAVRQAGDDPAQWHIDPLTSTGTGNPNWYRVVPDDAPVDRDPKRDGTAVVYTQSAADGGAAFDGVARADERVEVLAGSAADGFVTYIQRSRLFAFPDYISVKFIDLPEGGSTIAVYSRARYGRSDLDVNQKRVERWLAATRDALG